MLATCTTRHNPSISEPLVRIELTAQIYKIWALPLSERGGRSGCGPSFLVPQQQETRHLPYSVLRWNYTGRFPHYTLLHCEPTLRVELRFLLYERSVLTFELRRQFRLANILVYRAVDVNCCSNRIRTYNLVLNRDLLCR